MIDRLPSLLRRSQSIGVAQWIGLAAVATLVASVLVAAVQGNLTVWVALQLWVSSFATVAGLGTTLVVNQRHWTSVPVLFGALYATFLSIGSFVGLATAPADHGTAVLIGLGLLAFGLGTAIAARLAAQWHRPAPNRASAAPDDEPRGSRLTRFAPVVAFGVFLVISLWLFVVNGIPFLAAQPNLEYVAWASRAGRLLVALEFGLPISSVVILHVWRHEGRRGLLLGWATIAIASGMLLATSRRYQLFDLYIALVFTFILLPGAPIRRWMVVGMSSLILVVLVAVPLLRDPTLISAPNPVGIVRAAWFDTAHRVFGVQADGVRLLVETIPDRQPYFDGYTFRDELIRLPGQPTAFSLGRWLFRVRFEGLVPESELVGYHPPTAPGELYANFGWLGSLLGMALWGLAIQTACRVASRFRRHEVWMPVGGFAATYLVQGQLLGVYTTLQAVAWAALLAAVMTWVPARIERAWRPS